MVGDILLKDDEKYQHQAKMYVTVYVTSFLIILYGFIFTLVSVIEILFNTNINTNIYFCLTAHIKH